MNNPLVLYFGPLKESGHYLFYETGRRVPFQLADTICPWKTFEIDGKLQPGCPDPEGPLRRRTRSMCEGEAFLHHKGGWTALAFWDYTIDKRPASSSTYIAKGVFTFEEMVELAKVRFTERWNAMRFTVTLVSQH